MNDDLVLTANRLLTAMVHHTGWTMKPDWAVGTIIICERMFHMAYSRCSCRTEDAGEIVALDWFVSVHKAPWKAPWTLFFFTNDPHAFAYDPLDIAEVTARNVRFQGDLDQFKKDAVLLILGAPS